MAHVQLENLAIEKEQGVERLRLRRGGNATAFGEVIDESDDADGADVPGVALFVEEDVAPDPEPISLLGPGAQVPAAARG